MVGIDIVAIDRIEKFYKKFGEKSLKRFLTDEEIKLSNLSFETIAGFWAAKEAVSKTLGCGISNICSFHDIRICKDRSGAPYFTLPKHLIKNYQITDTALSISHDKGFAIAVACIKSSQKVQKSLSH